VLEVDDVEATARRILCHARDEQFFDYEHPEVPVYFRNMSDAKRVIDCINERYYGGHAALLNIGVYH
jgi:trimethylamine:corrinoid methyltransferase-like protein